MPRIALADPIWRQSPTVIVDTTDLTVAHAFVVQADGIDEYRFYWPGWTGVLPHGNGSNVGVSDPSQWSDDAVWIPWTDNGTARMNGFFNFSVGNTIWLGTPFAAVDYFNSQWMFNWGIMAPAVDGSFLVKSGFGWNSGRTGRLNIFGMTLPAPFEFVPAVDNSGNGIRDLWWDGSQWNWYYHGRPPGADEVALGRNSAVWDHASQQGRVFFAAANSSDPRSQPQLWDLFWDGSQWSWEQLGNPFGATTATNDQVIEMWSPVAVDGVQNGTYFLTVFVVGLHAANANSGNPQYRYELFAKEKIGAGAWSDWIQLGNPGNAPFTDIGNVGSSLIVVHQGARWMDGSLLRGSLFGIGPSTQPGPPNALIHLFHDNNGWQWDAPVLLPQPQPPAAPIWIASHVSCAALTYVAGYPGWHLTALMRDNTGAIWNREYDSNTATWIWQNLQ